MGTICRSEGTAEGQAVPVRDSYGLHRIGGDMRSSFWQDLLDWHSANRGLDQIMMRTLFSQHLFLLEPVASCANVRYSRCCSTSSVGTLDGTALVTALQPALCGMEVESCQGAHRSHEYSSMLE